jgi:hypothetical protein
MQYTCSIFFFVVHAVSVAHAPPKPDNKASPTCACFNAPTSFAPSPHISVCRPCKHHAIKTKPLAQGALLCVVVCNIVCTNQSVFVTFVTTSLVGTVLVSCHVLHTWLIAYQRACSRACEGHGCNASAESAATRYSAIVHNICARKYLSMHALMCVCMYVCMNARK